MAFNRISFEGRIIATERMPIEFGKSKSGNSILKFTMAETHSARNKNAAPKYQDKAKAPDAWVNTTTSWHKVTAFGDLAEALAQDPEFAHGAVFEITDGSYVEEDPYTTRDNVLRAGRPITLGDNSLIEGPKVVGDITLGSKTPGAVWDGVSDIPALEYRGSGGGEFVVNDDEGF